MNSSFSARPLALSVAFGILLMWLDFGDAFALQDSIGNLDGIFGHRVTEVFLVVASISVFLLFGRTLLEAGKQESGDKLSSGKASILTVKTFGPLLLYIVLLIMIDIDDIVQALGIHSILRASDLLPAYWLPMQVVYPVGSMIALILFGRTYYEIGRSGN